MCIVSLCVFGIIVFSYSKQLKDFEKSNSITLTNEYVILIVGFLPIILIIFFFLYHKINHLIPNIQKFIQKFKSSDDDDDQDDD